MSARQNRQSTVKPSFHGPRKDASQGWPKRRVDGDIKVFQVKSPIGSHKKQKNIDRLRSIRLHKIGQSTTGFTDDPVFMGNVLKLERNGIVETLLLAQPERPVQRSRSGGIAVTVDQYAAGQMTGEIQKFANGEYMVIEQQSGNGYALAWSSALPVLTLFTRAMRVLDDYADFTTGVVRLVDGSTIDGNAKEVVGAIMSAPDSVRFFRLESGAFSFGWKARVAIHRDYPQIEVNECGFTSLKSFDRALCKQLVERSATDRLGTDVDRSIQLVSSFLSNIPSKGETTKRPMLGFGNAVSEEQ